MGSRSNSPIALVTGALGFTGRYVCRSLQEAGYRVHGWGTVAEKRGRAESLAEADLLDRVDLLDRAAVRQRLSSLRPDLVIHLAAISFVAHSDVDEIYRVNIVGTRNLLSGLAAMGKRPSHVLLASSANIYGNASGSVDEATVPSPQNDYAVSKLAMEYMAKQFAESLPLTLVRPFNYSGVGQSANFLLPKIVEHFRRRDPVIELGNLDVSRDFNDVRNVAMIYGRLLSLEAKCETYNVCSGVEHSLGHVLELMQRISGHSIEVRVNPAFVRANEVKRLVGDPGKLVAAIGQLPEFSLESTLRWMYEADAA